jgi:hypothetical protein
MSELQKDVAAAVLMLAAVSFGAMLVHALL